MNIFNNPSKRVSKLEKKSANLASPYSKMLTDLQIHNSNIELFEQDLDDQIADLLFQKEKLGKDKAKNAQLIDKLNRLFDVDTESVE